MRDVAFKPPSANSPIASKAIVVLLICVSLVFIAVVTALGGGIVLAALIVAGLGFIFVGPRILSTWKPDKDGLFWSAIGLSLFVQSASTFSPLPLEWLMQLWFAGICVLMLPYWWRSPRYWIIALYVGLFIVYVVMAVISSRLGLSRRVPALVQLAYNCKVPLALMLGVCTVWTQTSEQRFWTFLKYLVLGLLAAAAFELCFPGIFYALARGAKETPEMDNARNPFFANKIRRVIAVFRHSGVLAYYCSVFSVLLFAKLVSAGFRGNRTIVMTLGGFLFLLILSGQRQETATTLACMLALLVVAKTKPDFSAFLFSTLLLATAAGGIFAFSDTAPVQTMAESWGLRPTVSAQLEARPVFYADSIQLANEHWPLGVGLGKFGGIAARDYDQSLYLQLGYGRYWWFRAGLYLLDTFWPIYIAESGWIGAGAMIFGAISLVLYTLLKAWSATNPELKYFWSMAFAAQFILFGISLTSSSYGDPKSMLVPMIFLGLALRRESKENQLVHG